MAKIETSTTGAGGAPPAPRPAASMNASSACGRARWSARRCWTACASSPAAQMKNPVMFVVYAGSILTTILWIMALRGQAEAPAGFILAITVWLWFTVLFANFAEALAEGRGKQQAATLRGLRTTIDARLLRDSGCRRQPRHARRMARPGRQPALRALRRGDVVLVEAGETIPGDGQVIAGVASVDESAITGESAPVIRESGGDFSSVTGGTRVLSDWIFVRIAADPGELPGPHDLHGRRRQAPEDAQRTGADHPAGGPDGGVPAGGGHADAVLDLRGLDRRRRHDGDRDGAGGAAGVPDPDHHRRPALGHRRGRHEPHDGRQCHRHLRPRGGSRRRRGRAAAGQDRHHHLRQPPGLHLPAGARRLVARAGRCRPPGLAGRRNARGTQHRGAGRQDHSRARAAAGRRRIRALHRPVPHERRKRRRTHDPQRRGRRRGRLDPGAGSVRARHGAAPGRGCGAARRTPLLVSDGNRALGVVELGHRQARHPVALRRAAPHGHQDRDDHRRQQAHSRLHRGRGRRGRLPGRSHAGSQAR